MKTGGRNLINTVVHKTNKFQLKEVIQLQNCQVRRNWCGRRSKIEETERTKNCKEKARWKREGELWGFSPPPNNLLQFVDFESEKG